MTETVTCKICNYRYVPTVPEDVRSHRRRHDQALHGIPARPAKSDVVVWSEGDYRISMLCALDCKIQRTRAQRVAVLANRESRYDFPPFTASEPYDNRLSHAFLLYHKNRIIGILVFSLRREIRFVAWQEIGSDSKRVEDADPLWTVDYVWVLKRFRGQKLSVSLMEAAASYFDFPLEKVAWYPPLSDDGLALARKVTPGGLYLGT